MSPKSPHIPRMHAGAASRDVEGVLGRHEAAHINWTSLRLTGVATTTFLEAAKAALEEAGEALHYTDITRRALQRGWIETKGATPEATMRARLTTALNDLGDDAEIVRVGRGIWALREWGPARRPGGDGDDTPSRPDGPRHWFLVTNPKHYDAEELFQRDTEVWGEIIRSAVPRRRLREEMRAGDRAFVYRSKPHADVFCEVEVVGDPYPRGDTHVVDVRAVGKLEPPVALSAMRACDELADMEFLRNSRVSISPLTPDQFAAIEGLVGGEVTPPEGYSHDLIMWQLIGLGRSLGCTVWIAADCRGKGHGDEAFCDHCLDALPDVGFNEQTVELVRGIDVLWLRGNSILAAFEIEHTTSIYSGLLRLSDLVALQPNITIDLYIVAPGSRRDQVVRQVNRPTFRRLRKPLSGICRFIPYDRLLGLLDRVEGLAGFLQVDLIQTVAEDCRGGAD